VQEPLADEEARRARRQPEREHDPANNRRLGGEHRAPARVGGERGPDGRAHAVMDGIEATRQVTANGKRTPRVIVLTTFDLDE
jgi:hypothetical protein